MPAFDYTAKTSRQVREIALKYQRAFSAPVRLIILSGLIAAFSIASSYADDANIARERIQRQRQSLVTPKNIHYSQLSEGTKKQIVTSASNAIVTIVNPPMLLQWKSPGLTGSGIGYEINSETITNAGYFYVDSAVLKYLGSFQYLINGLGSFQDLIGNHLTMIEIPGNDWLVGGDFIRGFCQTNGQFILHEKGNAKYGERMEDSTIPQFRFVASAPITRAEFEQSLRAGHSFLLLLPELKRCSFCKGQGYFDTSPDPRPWPSRDTTRRCDACRGTGKIEEYQCVRVSK